MDAVVILKIDQDFNPMTAKMQRADLIAKEFVENNGENDTDRISQIEIDLLY